MSLLGELRDAGLIVRPDHGWETATNNNRDRFETVGIISHWDAIKGSPPVSFYTKDNRFGGILYHILIRRNGTVDLLSQRYVWHAGDGDLDVLEACRNNIIPPPPTRSNVLGNPHFFSVAVNYHPDDGLMLQYNQLVTVNRVLLGHFGLSTNQVIDHRGWTTRKRDIDTINITEFRSNIGADMPLTAEDLKAIGKVVDERIAVAFGPITIPDEPNRKTFQTMVNAWHAYSQGRKLYVTLDEAHDYAKTAAETSDGDVAGAIDGHAANPDAHHA